MNRNGFFVWILSLIAFVVSLIPFVLFMFKPTVKHLLTAVAFIAVAAILYIIGTKLITHTKGFTAIHAILFYKTCCKNGFENINKCKKNPDAIKNLALKSDYSKNFDAETLFEMYSAGYELCKKKG